jgi:hypothetical protein
MTRPAPGTQPMPTAGASVGELVSSVTTDLSALMRQELGLAKAEAKQEVVKSGRARAGQLPDAARRGIEETRSPPA